MITVLCLSPSLDQTITLPHLAVGGTNRAAGKYTTAGGKGVNVAMTLAGMGERVRLAVFRHAQGAGMLFDALKGAGISCIAVDVPGTLRVNLKLLDASCDTVTEINAQSEAVPPEAMDAMEEAVVSSCRDSRWLVLTGSMPVGYPADAYARIIRRVRAQAPGCRIALDAEGEAFHLGVLEGPDFIKPNRHELELLAGERMDSDNTVIQAAQALAQSGVSTVLVSLDVAGSVLVTRDLVLRAGAVPVPVVTTVGAGDALVSGFVHARSQGLREAFAFGVAAAAARVAGRDVEAEAYLPQVQIKAV